VAARTGNKAVVPSFVSPFTENGNDDDMKHE